MMDETVADGTADSDTLVLEGYQFVKSSGESVLARSSLYFDHASSRLVVVEQIAKEISGMLGFDDRFQDRLELLAPCVHPNLTRLIPGGFTCGGRYYLMRENIEGQTLRQWMQNTEVTPAKAQQIILSLASALAVLHHHGAVHGAVTADQIWIDRDDAPKLELCPVSTFLEPKELVSLLGLEIVHTMPPEFTSGAPLTPQSDVYELGALYYELLTGAAPRGVIARISSSVKVDIRVSSVILKALSSAPADRQATIAEFCAPLLGHAAVSAHPAAESSPGNRPPRPLSKFLIAATIVVSLAASAGSIWGWKFYQNRKNQSAPVVVAEEEKKPEEVIATPTAAVTPRFGWVGIKGDANQAVMEFELLNVKEMQHLLTPIADPDNAAVFTPPQLTRYLLEDETGKALCEAKVFVPDARTVFSLPVALHVATPQGVRLVLQGPEAEPVLKSNLVTVSDAITDHQLSYAPSEDKPATPVPTAPLREDIPKLPTTPTASATAGDFYIYAAHLYLGDEVSLLKLQFGNAGNATLMTSDLTFQCAFSIDDTMDALLEAKSDALPTHARDLAAGGFTSKWLGVDGAYLAAGKRMWTKQTFRIDTSNPELLKTAKYMLVKINHRNTLVESNYENNMIVIPLDHPNQWHSFTQDPKDTVTTGETDPAADPNAPKAAEKAPESP